MGLIVWIRRLLGVEESRLVAFDSFDDMVHARSSAHMVCIKS